ncbi:MAG: hypothetical protein ACSHW4_15405 [Cellulophaga sp.]|uniref:hypothetical protein n=1 Tax=unclassified Cellulophaga TaxID=2634405 RepID=UPI0026E3FCFE|nr:MULTISPECIES: hypothetical protein [unclassified Cellulophaga]MDO6492331.1 hypothetical protein [Cellulophaga sp. 2_MG-2023]MDO6496169.1 hypothetical protein [Cellulophaga sp. 3_MG-2023]
MMTNKMKAFYFILSLSILVVSSCESPKKQQEEHPELAKEVKPPSEIISTKKAQTLFDSYSKRRAPLIQEYEDKLDPSTTFDVARYGYYDLETLKNYIAFIEQEAKKADVKISTLRFYLANYPDSKEYKHPKQNTFFIAPTTTVDGKEYPFSVITDGKTYKPKFLKDNFIIKPFEKTTTEEASFFPNISFFNEDDEQSLILNEFGLFPPPYN